MNLPALKDGVSKRKNKMLTPKSIGTRNVVFNSITSNITNTPKEFTWTPKMSSSKMSSQPRMLFKDSISRVSLKKLESLRNTHHMRYFNKQMYMIWLNTQLINLKTMFFSNFPNYFLTESSKFFKLKRVLSIFRFPNKVESILSNCMSKFVKFHFFSSYAKFKNRAHTTIMCFVVCAYSGAHFLFSFYNLRNRRFSLPRAEALGILHM